MYSLFTDYLLSKAPYTEGELAKIDAVTYKRKVKKGETLFLQNTYWTYNGFVCSGLIYNHMPGRGDQEKIVSFAPEKYWVGDRNSLLTGAPMPHSATALEDTHIAYIENDDFEKLRIVLPRFNDMMDSLIKKHIQVTQQRISLDVVLTDEERYRDFLKTKPFLMGRVPQHMIASYLNISDQNMDRIINGLPWKKSE